MNPVNRKRFVQEEISHTQHRCDCKVGLTKVLNHPFFFPGSSQSSYLCLFAKTNLECLWMHAKSYCSSSWNCFSFLTLLLHLLCRLYGQMLIRLRARSFNVVEKMSWYFCPLSTLLVVERMLSHCANPWILLIVSNAVGEFYSQPWPWRWPLTIHIKHWTSEEGREHGESVEAKKVKCGLKITCFQKKNQNIFVPGSPVKLLINELKFETCAKRHTHCLCNETTVVFYWHWDNNCSAN